MSNKELKIIIKIFELKEKKTQCIHNQSYANAAEFRDRERDYELKLLKLSGEHIDTSDEFIQLDRKDKMNQYFRKNFGIEYPNNTNPEFRKKILRQIKLNELGI